ncbi:MAG: Lar family restriction alleviation protein [Acidobacteriota bacterium]
MHRQKSLVQRLMGRRVRRSKERSAAPGRPVPCPFCEGLKFVIRMREGAELTYQVKCTGCGAAGPRAQTVEGAWQCWNGREVQPGG